MSVKMRDLWSEEPCDHCGTMGYATRSVSRPVSDVHLCDGCEGYENARKESATEIAALRAELEDLRAEYRLLETVRARGCECGDDDACAFVRERDALKAENGRLREVGLFLLSFVPGWADPEQCESNPGYDPTYYGTLTYEGDTVVREKVVAARAALGKGG